MHILIVDDEAGIREILSQMLTQLNHTVIVASSGLEALAALQKEIVDLIISDIMMPHMGGIELLEKLQTRPDAPPLIFLTAYASMDHAVEALRLGAADFLAKPIDLDMLRISLIRIEKQCVMQQQLTREREALALTMAHAEAERHHASQVKCINMLLRVSGDIGRLIHTESMPQVFLQKTCAALTNSGAFEATMCMTFQGNGEYEYLARAGKAHILDVISSHISPSSVHPYLKSFINAPDGSFFRLDPSLAENLKIVIPPPCNGVLIRIAKNDTISGVLGLVYQKGFADVDPEVLTLLEDIVREISLALAGMEELRRRKSAEAELETSRALITQTFICLQDAILLYDASRKQVITCNPATTRIFGYSESEVMEQSPSLLHTDRSAYDAFEHEVEISNGQVIRQDYQMRKKSGEIFPTEHTMLPIINTAGEYQGWVSVIRDITETQKWEAQLRQSEKLTAIGQLAAGVAHEINNPIGFIMSNLRTLHDYIKTFIPLIQSFQEYRAALSRHDQDMACLMLAQIDALEEEEDIQFILEDTEALAQESLEGAIRVRDLVQGLKSFARSDDQDMREADINEGIEATLKIVWNELKYHCTLHKKLSPLPRIPCNLGKLNQVFMNLLVNAAHAIKETGEITIETEHVDSEVRIRISDTGEGIPPDILSKIFDPFYTTKDVGKGTGLGLSISHGIIEEHGGTLDVQSTVGKGTEFCIHLPVS